MNIRDALIYQSPSLELQRAAADEIACLSATCDNLIDELCFVEQGCSLLEEFLEQKGLLNDFKRWKDDGMHTPMGSD